MENSTPIDLKKLANMAGGKIEEVGGPLPDGSGFAVMSFPLPKDHWLTKEGYDNPPMPFRMGMSDPRREEWAAKIREAARYAIRASTDNGKIDDFDPDAMVQNFTTGMLGYWTPTGLSSESMFNPGGISDDPQP
jgi:hypothetical protein